MSNADLATLAAKVHVLATAATEHADEGAMTLSERGRYVEPRARAAYWRGQRDAFRIVEAALRDLATTTTRPPRSIKEDPHA